LTGFTGETDKKYSIYKNHDGLTYCIRSQKLPSPLPEVIDFERSINDVIN
jgi:hypothetical protein